MENDRKTENEEEKTSPIERTRQYLYYFIIGIISFVALVFLPMLGSSVGMDWNLPTTTAGWIVWAVMKIIVATLNVLIFHSFVQQGRLNVKDHPNYIEATQILQKVHVKNAMPRSPAQFTGKQYGRKGVMIFLSTALATVALTQAALAFNWIDMLTYLFTIIMGIIFGILQMKTTEKYWSEEYLAYAKFKQEEMEQEERRNKEYAAALRSKSNPTLGITIDPKSVLGPYNPAKDPRGLPDNVEKKEEGNADDRR